MRDRRPLQSLASSPTLVGALTVLIVTVAVFLAYNANNGLPFVPTYQISAQVPDTNALVRGNDVRIGGIRVGVVQSIQPVSHPNGSVSAKVNLKLDKNVQPLPRDSTVTVRSQSALGLKYLQLRPGSSTQGFPEGAEMPLSAARPESVDIDQVLNVFDQPTRAAIQTNLLEFGNAVAGRGAQLNGGIQELRVLLDQLQPVAHTLASPTTGLGRFFRALEATAAEVAPVAETQGHLFVSLDVTFTALAQVARPFIQQSIVQSPPTLDTANATLPVIRPFLRDSQVFFANLEPGTRSLAQSAPSIAAALQAGVPALRASPALNAQLAPTAQALLDFQNTPGVTNGLSLLTSTNSILSPTLGFVTPAQTVCNYATLLFGNVASTVSEGDGVGTWQRFIAFNPPAGADHVPSQPNNEGTPSSAPANGPDPANHLHVNPYPNTASPGQSPRECAAGNEPYLAGQTLIGNPPGNLGTATAGQPKKKGKG